MGRDVSIWMGGKSITRAHPFKRAEKWISPHTNQYVQPQAVRYEFIGHWSLGMCWTWCESTPLMQIRLRIRHYTLMRIRIRLYNLMPSRQDFLNIDADPNPYQSDGNLKTLTWRPPPPPSGWASTAPSLCISKLLTLMGIRICLPKIMRIRIRNTAWDVAKEEDLEPKSSFTIFDLRCEWGEFFCSVNFIVS